MTDLQKYYALKQVLLQAKLEVKGDAVNSIASLFSWYDSLESKFTPKDPMKIEETKKPIGKK